MHRRPPAKRDCVARGQHPLPASEERKARASVLRHPDADVKTYAGTLAAHGLRFGVVAARFNSLVTDRLLDGALAALRHHGAAEDDIEVVRVPGSFEEPLFARLLAASGRGHAVGCVG